MSRDRVRKKPCPYCGKRLQAASKGRWRNNLARHLQNCAPHQREWISMTEHLMFAMVEHLLGVKPSSTDYVAAAKKNSEVEALERLYKES
jgi:hypothetical protein